MSIGCNISRIRKEQNLTIKDLSIMTNVTTSLISQIENDKANPSLSTLIAISNSLGVDIGILFEHTQKNQVNPVTRANEKNMISHSKGIVHYLLNENFTDKFAAHISLIEPGASSVHSPELNSSDKANVEFGYVLSGKVQVDLDDNTYILNPGDSICFNTKDKHVVSNNTNSMVELIWLMIN